VRPVDLRSPGHAADELASGGVRGDGRRVSAGSPGWQRSLSAAGGGFVGRAGRAADRVSAAAAAAGAGRRRRRRRRRGRRLVHVLVDGAPARVHEEVDDRRHLESELFGDRRLDLLARALYLLEDGDQRASLDLGEHHARLLGRRRRAAAADAAAGRYRRLLTAAAVRRTSGLLRCDRLRRAQQRPVSTALARCATPHTHTHRLIKYSI